MACDFVDLVQNGFFTPPVVHQGHDLALARPPLQGSFGHRSAFRPLCLGYVSIRQTGSKRSTLNILRPTFTVPRQMSHIPSAGAEGVRHRGVGVLTLDEANMLGARDDQHLAFGREENCVLVTHDDDFLRSPHQLWQNGSTTCERAAPKMRRAPHVSFSGIESAWEWMNSTSSTMSRLGWRR
jgi:hypothetical protein